jgi:hypothetical protein
VKEAHRTVAEKDQHLDFIAFCLLRSTDFKFSNDYGMCRESTFLLPSGYILASK